MSNEDANMIRAAFTSPEDKLLLGEQRAKLARDLSTPRTARTAGITARITALGKHTQLPKARGATEAYITIDGTGVGYVTLRHDSAGLLVEWGVEGLGYPPAQTFVAPPDGPQSWCAGVVGQLISSARDATAGEQLVNDIVHAVRLAATHYPAAAIFAALGVGSSASARLVGEEPGAWSMYARGLRASSNEKVDGWLAALEARGTPLVVTTRADRCTAARVAVPASRS
jgi:hypothetical protein